MHYDPERRALAHPRHDVAVRAGSAGSSRLALHAGAHDESHVWVEEVRGDAHNRHEHREASPQGRATQPACAQDAPADAPVTRIELPVYSATPNRMCAMSDVAGSAARSYDRPRRTTLTMRVAATKRTRTLSPVAMRAPQSGVLPRTHAPLTHTLPVYNPHATVPLPAVDTAHAALSSPSGAMNTYTNPLPSTSTNSAHASPAAVSMDSIGAPTRAQG